MNISLNKENYSIDNVYFYDPIKNSVIENSNFIRIIYSNSSVSINGIFIKIEFDFINKTNDFTKQKFIINPYDNQIIINYIKTIEYDIIEKINIKNKKKIYKIYEQLMSGYIKNIDNNNYTNNFILKISGLWESEKEYGLTFKFIDFNHQ
jgi:hypothetical protein